MTACFSRLTQPPKRRTTKASGGGSESTAQACQRGWPRARRAKRCHLRRLVELGCDVSTLAIPAQAHSRMTFQVNPIDVQLHGRDQLGLPLGDRPTPFASLAPPTTRISS